MSEIEELERRITAALDRIGRSAEAMDTQMSGTDADELAELQGQLEEEKLASAQLEERNKKMREKYEEAREALDSQLEGQREAIAKLDMEMQRLRAANDQLRTSNAALREANEKGVGDAHLINKAMLAELEALRAARAVDKAEVAAITETIGTVLTGPMPKIEEGA